MNRIILYCFILTAVSISLHGAPLIVLKELIRDVNNLKIQMKDVETQLPVPSENDSDDLSCFVTELRKFEAMPSKQSYKKTMRRLLKKVHDLPDGNCTMQNNPTRNTAVFLDKMENILQRKFKG